MIFEIHMEGELKKLELDRAYTTDSREFVGIRGGIEVLRVKSERWTYFREIIDPFTGKPVESSLF